MILELIAVFIGGLVIGWSAKQEHLRQQYHSTYEQVDEQVRKDLAYYKNLSESLKQDLAWAKHKHKGD
jgi:hypothetical protein